jgi:hypothetical protein
VLLGDRGPLGRLRSDALAVATSSETLRASRAAESPISPSQLS